MSDLETLTKKVLWTSFLVTSVFGSWFLVAFWSAREGVPWAIYTASTFVLAMAAVHCVGYQQFQRQFQPSKPPEPEQPFSNRLAPEYKPAVQLAVTEYLVFLVLTALMLDGGGAIVCCFIAILGHLAAILLIALRRPIAPSRLDLGVIRYGFLALIYGVLRVNVWLVLG